MPSDGKSSVEERIARYDSNLVAEAIRYVNHEYPDLSDAERNRLVLAFCEGEWRGTGRGEIGAKSVCWQRHGVWSMVYRGWLNLSDFINLEVHARTAEQLDKLLETDIAKVASLLGKSEADLRVLKSRIQPLLDPHYIDNRPSPGAKRVMKEVWDLLPDSLTSREKWHWLWNSNPLLGQAPVNAIIAGRYDEARAAAQALINGS